MAKNIGFWAIIVVSIFSMGTITFAEVAKGTTITSKTFDGFITTIIAHLKFGTSVSNFDVIKFTDTENGVVCYTGASTSYQTGAVGISCLKVK